MQDNMNGPGGIDTSDLDRALEETGHLAGEAGSAAMAKVLEKLGLDVVIRKIKRTILLTCLTIFVAAGAFICLYGAADYISQALKDLWYTITHEKEGQLDDFYNATYYDQAENILSKMEDGTADIGTDMSMLSDADFRQILEHVVEYNKDTSFETSPERIKYWYNATRHYEDDLTGQPEETPVELYSMATVSYQSYGDETDAEGENIFALPWQTIVALCEMMAEDSEKDFGSDNDGWKSTYYEDFAKDPFQNTSLDGYFVTNDQIQSICELVDFNYNAYKPVNGMDYVEAVKKAIKDGTAVYGGGNYPGNPNNTPNSDTYGIEQSAQDMMHGTFILFSGWRGNDEIKYERIPAIAMKDITNYYMVVEYLYEDDVVDNEAVRRCCGREITIDAKRFYNMVTQYIPNFTFTHFLELLRALPGSESEVKKYEHIRDLYERGKQAEEASLPYGQVVAAYQEKTVYGQNDAFYGNGFYVSRSIAGATDFGQSSFSGQNAIWLGTHDENNAYNDFLEIADYCYSPIDQSDDLTLDEIKQILQDIKKTSQTVYSAKNPTDEAEKTAVQILQEALSSDVFANKLYNWQQDRQCSVTAMLAISVHESGHFTNSISRNKWNFFSIRNGHTLDWNDYKSQDPGRFATGDMLSAAIGGAFITQMDYIADHYFFSSYGQNSFYRMQFNTYDLTIPSQEAYLEEEKKIIHSYCPWWEDNVPPAWCNNVGMRRESLLNKVGKTASSQYLWPAPSGNFISSYFGMRIHPIQNVPKLHAGIDIIHAISGASTGQIDGTKVVATRAGEVITSGYSDSAGWMVTIDHGDGMKSKYMHLKTQPFVSVGQLVAKGQEIGFVGSTGNSTGPHLHFQIEKYGVPVNPLEYVAMPAESIYPEASGNVSFSENTVNLSLPGLSTSYKIAWVSDLHLIVGDVRENPGTIHDRYYGTEFVTNNGIRPDILLPDLIQRLNNGGFDLVIFGGDMLDYFSVENLNYLNQYLKQLIPDFLYIRSDHDYDEQYKALADVGKGAYSEHNSVDFDIFDNLKVKNVKENGELYVLGINSSTKPISNQQKDAVEKRMKENVPILIATHVPYRSKAENSSLENYSNQNKGKIYYWAENSAYYKDEGRMAEYMNKISEPGSSVKLVLAGHIHGQTSWNGKMENDTYEIIFPPAFRGNIGVINIKPTS